MHPKEEKYGCPRCPGRFSRKPHLFIHMRCIHDMTLKDAKILVKKTTLTLYLEDKCD
jgi:hypothetical protein